MMTLEMKPKDHSDAFIAELCKATSQQIQRLLNDIRAGRDKFFALKGDPDER